MVRPPLFRPLGPSSSIHRCRPFRSRDGNGDANHVEQVDQHVGFDLVIDGRLGTERGVEVDFQQPRSASAIEHHIEPKDLEALRVVLTMSRRGKEVGERPAHDVLNTDGGLDDEVINGAPNLPGSDASVSRAPDPPCRPRAQDPGPTCGAPTVQTGAEGGARRGSDEGAWACTHLSGFRLAEVLRHLTPES